MKKYILLFANLIAIFWKIIPNKIRLYFITSIFILESRNKNAKKGIINLFYIKDKLEWIINERAIVIGNGEHPKHYLMNYHQFFIDRIVNGQNVLDVGCGYGSVAFSIAKYHKKSEVLGVDLDNNRLNQAIKNKKLKNLNFYKGDATVELPKGNWQVVVLSNVLEHIADRKSFLENLKKRTKANLFLIRVPLYERDWQIPLREELKINYYNDNDHKIEHKIEEFKKEMKDVRLNIDELYTKWGEIWACCSNESKK